MIFTIFTTILVVFWTVLCFVVYGYHYMIEVVFGKTTLAYWSGQTDCALPDLPISGQSPCSAHAALKQLIQRVILEALDLPKLRQAEGLPEGSDEVHERTYEDLLATAVLNKVSGLVWLADGEVAERSTKVMQYRPWVSVSGCSWVCICVCPLTHFIERTIGFVWIL